jgi:hypothetical protein
MSTLFFTGGDFFKNDKVLFFSAATQIRVFSYLPNEFFQVFGVPPVPDSELVFDRSRFVILLILNLSYIRLLILTSEIYPSDSRFSNTSYIFLEGPFYDYIAG